MRRSAWTTGVAAIAVALSLGVAACGGSDTGGEDGGTKPGAPQPGAKQGGKLTALWTGDVDFADCGRTYYQMGYFICNATQKPLYSYKPDDQVTLVPDLADKLPEISEDGKTVTITLKKGVMYSKPYSKEVTSADIKYAIERGFFTSVASGFTRLLLRRPRGRGSGRQARLEDLRHHHAGRLHRRVASSSAPWAA